MRPSEMSHPYYSRQPVEGVSKMSAACWAAAVECYSTSPVQFYVFLPWSGQAGLNQFYLCTSAHTVPSVRYIFSFFVYSTNNY